VWSDLVGVLQSLSIRANTALIWLTALPAYITGDIVHLPAGTLEIAGGCSGLHSFVVGLALAALYGELTRDPLRWRLAWLGLMGVLAMIGNWIRIFVIIAAAEATDMHTSLITVDHYWFGWLLFLLCFVGFLWLAGRLRTGSPTVPVMGFPGADEARPDHATAPLGGTIAALLALAMLPGILYATEPLRMSSHPVGIVWPSAPLGWQGPTPLADEDWKPLFRNASIVSRQQYVGRDGQRIEIFIAAYARQQQDAKLLGYGNSLLGAEGDLQLLDEQVVQAPDGRWDQRTVEDAGGAHALIWSRYDIGGHAFVRPRLGQLWYGIATLSGPALSSITALRAVCRPDCSTTHQRLLEVAAPLQPAAQLE